MKKINYLTMAVSVLMLCLIAANILMLLNIKLVIKNGDAIKDWMGVAIAAFIIIIALSHLLGLTNLFLQFKHFRNERFLRTVTFVIGFFSIFLLAVNVVMLHEIGNEYMHNHNITSEWNLVFIGHIAQGLFAILLLAQCIYNNKELASTKSTDALKDESLFLTVHQVGIVTAVFGFLLIFILSISSIPHQYFDGLLFMLCIIALIPYVLADSYWLFTMRKTKFKDWFDEKQLADISRGALSTLAISVVGSLGFYFLYSCKIVINVSVYFPLYLFQSLLFFSGITFYLSKKSL